MKDRLLPQADGAATGAEFTGTALGLGLGFGFGAATGATAAAGAAAAADVEDDFAKEDSFDGASTIFADSSLALTLTLILTPTPTLAPALFNVSDAFASCGVGPFTFLSTPFSCIWVDDTDDDGIETDAEDLVALAAAAAVVDSMAFEVDDVPVPVPVTVTVTATPLSPTTGSLSLGKDAIAVRGLPVRAPTATGVAAAGAEESNVMSVIFLAVVSISSGSIRADAVADEVNVADAGAGDVRCPGPGPSFATLALAVVGAGAICPDPVPDVNVDLWVCKSAAAYPDFSIFLAAEEDATEEEAAWALEFEFR